MTCVVAVGFGHGHFLRGSRRTDRPRAQCFQPLPQQQPDPTRGCMHQHGVAGLDRIAGGEQELRRQPLEHDGRGHVECNGIGQFDQPLGGNHPLGAIPTQRQCVGHSISRLELRDSRADFCNHSRSLSSGNQWAAGPGIQAAAKIRVDEVHADRALHQAHFAAPRNPGVERAPLHRLGAASHRHHHSHVGRIVH